MEDHEKMIVSRAVREAAPMSTRSPSQGEAWLSMADIDRIVSSTAERAATFAVQSMPSRTEIQEMIDKSIVADWERMGIEKGDYPSFRKDLAAMRASREMREALISHGIKAVMTVILTGIATAVWLSIKGAK